VSDSKLTVLILDDSFPKIPEFIDESIYSEKIDSTSLAHLVKTGSWSGQHNLKELTSLLVKSEHIKSGELLLYGFTHPSLCLDEIDDGLQPDIIIFDWEYGSETNNVSSRWLKEILDLTKSFVFVYSMIRNSIPPFLNKSVFDEHSERLQLFLKGDRSNSVFSSEEFIHQYIVSQITMSNEIKIQGKKISFLKNGYLDNPTDILYLERILGRISLINKLKKDINSISNESIEELLNSIELKFYFQKEKNRLIASDWSFKSSNRKTDKEFSAVEVAQKFGLVTLQELMEIGVIKIPS